MSPGYTYRARQRPAEMLQSVACLVGAGKTVAARAAVAAPGPDPAHPHLPARPDHRHPRHPPPDGHRARRPARPRHATLAAQAAALSPPSTRARPRPAPGHRRSPPAAPRPARGDPDAHQPELDSASPLACLLIGQPTLRRMLRLGVLAALDQRIALRYAMPAMTPEQTASYITHHLKLAGRSDTLFSDDAIALDPRHRPRPAPRRQQPRHPGPRRRLAAARPSSTSKPPAPPSPRSRQTDHHRDTTRTTAPPAPAGGAVSCPRILTANDANILILSDRGQRLGGSGLRCGHHPPWVVRAAASEPYRPGCRRPRTWIPGSLSCRILAAGWIARECRPVSRCAAGWFDEMRTRHADESGGGGHLGIVRPGRL